MAAYQLLAGLPPLTLDAGCTVTVEAINPTTGAAVTGVTVSSVTIYSSGDTIRATRDTGPVLLAFEPLA